jgi:hypothetical protein
MKNYIDSQQHWEDSINADYDYKKAIEKEQQDNRSQPDDRVQPFNKARRKGHTTTKGKTAAEFTQELKNKQMENSANEFKTTHNLDFKTSPYASKIAQKPMQRFQIGTCLGLFGVTHEGYEIHAVNNTELGNGHFEDVLEWFEYACKRDSGSLIFTNVPDRFKKHLIEKRGFVETTRNDVEKTFATF